MPSRSRTWGWYCVAHERLCGHWRKALVHRLIELRYEEIVADPSGQARRLLEPWKFEFEPAWLAFEHNRTSPAAACATQVRERIHARSVGKWERFAHPLRPLGERLEAEGVVIDQT